MQLGKAQMRQAWECDRKKARRPIFVLLMIAIAVFFLCLCFKYEQYNEPGFFYPVRYFRVLISRLMIAVSSIPKGAYWHNRQAVLDALDVLDIAGATIRFHVTWMAFVAGAGLAVAGAVFQTVYKNPMASPNMLGASTGVQLGNIIMVTLYSGQAAAMVMLRYKYCYILTAVCVAGVIVTGKLAGDRTGNPSVMKMVMAGSIINQGLGTIAMYFMYQLNDEDLLVYQQIGMGTYISIEKLSLLIFFIVMAVALIPMICLRYLFNVTGLDDSEARAAGMNPAPYRMAGQICGVLMVTAAMIHCGQAGMLSMVIPFMVRNAVGSDFRKVFAYSALSGGILMMICRTLSTCIAFKDANGDVLVNASWEPLTLPATFLINIFLLPFFMVILAKQGRAFD